MKIFTIIGVITLLIVGCFFTLLLLKHHYRSDKVFLIPQNYEGPLIMIEDPIAKDSVEIYKHGFLFDFRKASVFNKSLVLRLRGLFIEGGVL